MAKAFAYVVNTTPQTITGGGAVNVGTALHGFGCTRCGYTIQVAGGNIVLHDCGYYAVSIGADVSASAAGTVTLSLYQDGVLVAQSAETIAAADDPASIAFPAGIKVGNANSTLTVVISASAGNPIVNSIYTTVLKA